MSEEEKGLVEKFQNLYIKEFNNEPITSDDRLSYIECALITNLIEKLEKELNSLKEIEKSHKEENGKLRVELEQEKVISEYWQDRFLEQVKYGNKITVSGDPVIIKNVIDTVTYDYIHKDKIKELLENEIIDISGFRCIAVEDIEELLEEK